MPQKRGIIGPMGDVTAATRVLLSKLPAGGMRGAPTRRRRKKVTAKASTTRRRKRATTRTRSRATSPRRKSAKRAYMVKGSAAAKRHMAKLRRMRKR